MTAHSSRFDTVRSAAALRMPVSRFFSPQTEIGLGELVKRITSFFGITPCEACLWRARALDTVLVFTPREQTVRVTLSSDCTSFKGACTGFGGTQCVTAPSSLEPDAPTITQCCSGRFQYPWVELCPGKAATQGCGFCLF